MARKSIPSTTDVARVRHYFGLDQRAMGQYLGVGAAMVGHLEAVDLAADKSILQKGLTQIAVEVKNFFPEKGMNVNELKTSIGQYALYIRSMKRQFPQHKLYLAVPEDAYKNIFSTPLMQEIISDFSMSLLIYSPTSETIVEWKH